MARFTFAVCIRCGVQSPPILLVDKNIVQELKAMGWVLDEGKFVVRAICPECHARPGEKYA